MSDYSSSSDSEEYYSGGSEGEEENYPSDSDSDHYSTESGTEEMDSDSGSPFVIDSSGLDSSDEPDSDSDKDSNGGGGLFGLDNLFSSSASVGASGDSHDGGEEEEVAEGPRKPATVYREYISYAAVEEVVCLGCFELPKDPISLSCGHVICRECAKEAVDVFKATSTFTQRYKPKEEVGENDDVLVCPVCMEIVIIKGGIKECKTDEHTEELVRISEDKECLCGMCLSEFSAGVNCHVERGIYECDKCGPLCERHCHCFVIGHEHGKHKRDDKNHMRLVSYPLKLKRVSVKAKGFNLGDGVSGKIVFNEFSEPCDAYCETCKKPVSRPEYYRKCAKDGHKTISLEEAVKKIRKEKEEAEAQHESLEKQRKEAVSKAVDGIEDKLADLSAKRLVAKSLLEDGIYTTNMSGAQQKIREFYARVREASSKCEEELLKQLEDKEKELKESLSQRCSATEVLSTDAEMLVKAIKMNLDFIDSDEDLVSLIARLGKLDSQLIEASNLDQKELDMTEFVKEKRGFTDEGLKISMPSAFSIEGVSSGNKRASAENYEEEEEKEGKKEEKEDDEGGELSIEAARKKVKETTTKDDLKKIDSSLTFRSVMGTSLSSLSSEVGRDMFCAALFDIVTRLRPDFSMDMIPILTESFCSLHEWDEIKKYEKVSDVFQELKAIALTLGMEL